MGTDLEQLRRRLADAGVAFDAPVPPPPHDGDPGFIGPPDPLSPEGLAAQGVRFFGGAGDLARASNRPEVMPADTARQIGGTVGGGAAGAGQAPVSMPSPPSPETAVASMSPPPMSSPPAAAPTFVPAGYSRSRDPIKDSTYKSLDDAMKAQADAEIAKNRAQQTGYQVQSEQLDSLAREYEGQRLRYQAQEQERNGRYESARAAANDAVSQVANWKADPFRMIRDANFGTKVAVGIGAALGGMLQGLNGGTNTFLDRFDSLIQKDIDAQNQELSGKKFAADAANSQLGQLRTRLGDERAADLTIADMAYAQIEKQAKAALARTGSQTAQENGARLLADLQAKRAEIQAQRDQRQYVAAHTVGGGAGYGAMGKERTMLFTGLDGKTYRAQTPESYNKITAQLGYVTNIQGNINKALAIRQAASAIDLANPYSTASKQLAALQAETAQIVTVARGQGAMSKGDQAVADAAIGSMTGLLENNDTVLRGTSGRWGEQMAREIKSLGAEEIQRGYTVNARGQIVPDPQYVGASGQPKSQAMPSGATRIGGP